jgi:excisionase family DNA binding protein
VERLLSPHDVAELVPIGYHAVLRAIRSGELRASELRGRYAIRPADFEAWVQRNVVKPAPSHRPARPSSPASGALTTAGGFRAKAGATQRSRSER